MKTLAELRDIEAKIFADLQLKRVEIGELLDRLDWVQRDIKRLRGYDVADQDDNRR